MSFRKWTCACAVLLALVIRADAAYAQDSEPERLAQEYFKVLQAEGFTAVGRFMHPDALAQFRTMMLPLFEAEAAAGDNEIRRATFGAASTINEVKALDPAMFMNGFMNIVAAQTGGARLSFDRLEVVGVVREGNQRHVLARITVGADELSVTQFEVLSFIPFEDRWRLQLSGELKGLAAALLSRAAER